MPRCDLGVLFLHALPLDGRMWAGQRGILSERTYAPDLYGFGADLRQWAQHCLKHVPTQRFVVVGCSVGGSCALEILRIAPERVAASVLIGTKARHDPEPALATDARNTIDRYGVRVAWEQFWKPLFSFPYHAEAHERCRAIALDQSPNDLMNGLAAFHTRESREDIVKSSTSPIHVVSGGFDKFPGMAYSRRLAELSAKATLHVVGDCGHYAPVVRPEETASIVVDVVNQVSRA